MKFLLQLLRIEILFLLSTLHSLADEVVFTTTTAETEVATAGPEITATIEAATAWHLKRYRSLQGFMSREGEFYDNLHIERVHDSSVVMTIFHDGREVETINLKQEQWDHVGKLRQLLQEKGIRYKSNDQLQEIHDRRRKLSEQRSEQQRRIRAEKKADRERRGIDLRARLNDKVAQRKREREQKENGHQIVEEDEAVYEEPHQEVINVRDEL